MEKTTGGLDLNISTNGTFNNDDIQETIVEYGENFKSIEKYLTEATTAPNYLANGELTELGKILWNSQPTIGGHVGWVNTREGFHAPLWTPKTVYVLGQEVKANPDNGNIYRCITPGTSMQSAPFWQIGNGVEFYDASGDKWYPQRNYQVNDVIFPTNGSKLFYYICETSGLTNSIEPSWASQLSGAAFTDGSVVWRKEPTIKWKQVGVSSEFRPFGKIE